MKNNNQFIEKIIRFLGGVVAGMVMLAIYGILFGENIYFPNFCIVLGIFVPSVGFLSIVVGDKFWEAKLKEIWNYVDRLNQRQ